MAKREKKPNKKYIHLAHLLENELYKKSKPEIRKFWGIPRGGFKSLKDHEIWHTYQVRKRVEKHSLGSLYNDVYKLLEEVGYGKEWHKIAYNDIVFGKVFSHYLTQLRSDLSTPYIDPNIVVINNTIQVTVYPNTLQKNYSDAWEKIKVLQKTLRGYRRERKQPNSTRDKHLDNEVSKGKGYSQVANELAEKTDKYGEPSDQTIRIAVKRYKKRLGKH